MKIIMNMKKTILASFVGLSMIALIIGLWSYSRAEGNTISICVKKSGLVYVIGDGFKRDDCKKNESLLTWNIQGPQGPKGDKGDKGDPGIQGRIGPIGPQGIQGIQGEPGKSASLGAGNIAFINPDNYRIALLTNGETWEWNDTGWFKSPNGPHSLPIPVDNIVVWYRYMFLDKDSNVWNWDNSMWNNIGHPPYTPTLTPTPTPTPASLMQDDFNNYSNGNIVGQGGWINRENGNSWVVENLIAQEGTKALYSNNSGADSVITKNNGGNKLANGKQSFYIRSQERSNWSDTRATNVQIGVFQDSWDGPSKAALGFEKDGHVNYVNGKTDQRINFDVYNDNAWNLVEMEWRSSDASARYRINNGAWTDWVPFTGGDSFTGFDTVGFVTWYLGTGGVYIDFLH